MPVSLVTVNHYFSRDLIGCEQLSTIAFEVSFLLTVTVNETGFQAKRLAYSVE